jgi:hypothetical protein
MRVSIDIQTIIAPDGKPPDIVLYIGPKEAAGLYLKEGNETVSTGSTITTLDVDAKQPYEVSGWTSWGAHVTTTETTSGHYQVQFDRPAPAPSGNFHWQVYHYN